MRRYASLILFCAATAALWFWTRPTPEQVIEKRLRDLAAAVSPDGNEGNFAKIAASQRIAGYFTLDAVVNLEGVPGVGSSLSGRTEISQSVMAARNWTGGSRVVLENIQVIVAPSNLSATVIFGASVNRSSREGNWGQTLKSTWRYEDGNWLIRSLEPSSPVPVQSPN